MNSQKIREIAVVSVIGMLVVSGCAAPGGGEASSGNGNPCNVGAAAAGGAVLGGIFASQTKKSVGTGAVIGGAIGAFACLAINAYSHQVKTSEAVEKDYQHKNRTLPPSPTIVTFSNTLTPGQKQAIHPGESVKSMSKIEVVRGKDVPITDVSETLTVYDIDGNEIKASTKSLSESTAGSGGFESTFEMTMPSAAPQGFYTFKTKVAVNGQVLKEAAGKVEVASVVDKTGNAIAMR
ncbi:MAG TPA: hypothetical protein VK832_20480 [Burkholderiaceae bacterium]|jgi:hypothetical protein|nr:hypothetical protein [Burkholderiaceae bacterium]